MDESSIESGNCECESILSEGNASCEQATRRSSDVASKASGASLRSPAAKKAKMVLETLDANQYYLQQLESMRSRVNLLDLSDERSSNVTPRMLEVPPKKACLKELPGVHGELDASRIYIVKKRTDADVKHKSIWTESKGTLADKSTNTDNVWFCLSDNDSRYDKIAEGSSEMLKAPLEPNIIVNSPPSSHSTTYEKFDTPSNVTTIDSPSPISSPYVHELGNLDVLKRLCTPDKASVASSTYTVAPLLTQLYMRERKHGELENFTDEIEMEALNCPEYNVPIRTLSSTLSIESVREAVSDLALRVFKSKEKVVTGGEVERPNEAPKSDASFKDITDEVKKYSDHALALQRNVANILAERRVQNTSLNFYKVPSAGAEGRAVELREAGSSEDISEANNRSWWRCCDITPCLDFMFPKRPNEFFYM